ncbi:MAG: tetratricopeptide repeat protein [Gemmatimonadota bacterium]|nr:tetratricopeptide repeat protein [Gemmatimonadota bacterium]
MKPLTILGRCSPLLVLSACATSTPQPVISPTGIVYELGTPPVETRNSQTATLFLRQNRVDRALELALEGIQEDSTNSIHYFLAGVAHARLRHYASSDSMFRIAQRIYPAYELEIEPEREAAWGSAFNQGLEAYENGDVEGAIMVWNTATGIYDLRPEVHRNLAGLLTVEGQYPEAIDVYEKALFGLRKVPVTRLLGSDELTTRKQVKTELEEALAQLLLLTDQFAEAEPLLRRRLERNPDNPQVRSDLAAALNGLGRDAEAGAIYGALLSEESLETAQVFNLGVGLFRSGDYARATDAFRRLTDLQPNSRDAWFNLANSLFAGEFWEQLIESGERLLEFDPLGENTGLIVARAHLEMEDREGALKFLEQTEQLPVFVDQLQMQSSGGVTTVVGRLIGNTSEPETPITLQFFFYDDAGALVGSPIQILETPPTGEGTQFQVQHLNRASAYRYELVN